MRSWVAIICSVLPIRLPVLQVLLSSLLLLLYRIIEQTELNNSKLLQSTLLAAQEQEAKEN